MKKHGLVLALLVALAMLAPAARPAAAAPGDDVWGVVSGVPASVTLEDVAAASPDAAWAVGSAAESGGGAIYRLLRRGGRWEALPDFELPQAPRAVHAAADGTVWAVGDGGLVARRDAQGWRVLPAPPGAATLWSVMAADATHVWAGGVVSPNGETRGALFFFDGSGWQSQAVGGGDAIYDIAAGRDGAAYAVSSRELFRLRGGAWVAEPLPDPCGGTTGCYINLASVWTPGGDDVWVAGAIGSSCFACSKASALLLRRDASGWHTLLPGGARPLGALERNGPPVFAPLTALDFAGPESGLAVGAIQNPADSGPVRPLAVRYDAGAAAFEQLPATVGWLRGVAMTGPGVGLAVGDRGLILALGAPAAPPTAPVADPRDGSRFFGETGHTLRGRFRASWESRGGLAQFGYPLTEEYQEDGRVVQYFERARFELHLENAPPYDVLLGLLARESTVARTSEPAFLPAAPVPGWRYAPETRHNLAPELAGHWDRTGGLAVYGYPISEPLQEVNQADGRSYLVQYFERNRLEYHPELPEPYRVSLGLLGSEILRARGWTP